MGLSGLEPPTSRLSGGRSNRLSYKPISFNVEFGMWKVELLSVPALFESFKPRGGDKRDRTADPLLAKQVLSQLSYTPVYLLKVFKGLQN